MKYFSSSLCEVKWAPSTQCPGKKEEGRKYPDGEMARLYITRADHSVHTRKFWCRRVQLGIRQPGMCHPKLHHTTQTTHLGLQDFIPCSCLSIFLSFYQPACLFSVCPLACLSTYVSVGISVCLYVYVYLLVCLPGSVCIFLSSCPPCTYINGRQ